MWRFFDKIKIHKLSRTPLISIFPTDLENSQIISLHPPLPPPQLYKDLQGPQKLCAKQMTWSPSSHPVEGLNCRGRTLAREYIIPNMCAQADDEQLKTRPGGWQRIKDLLCSVYKRCTELQRVARTLLRGCQRIKDLLYSLWKCCIYLGLLSPPETEQRQLTPWECVNRTTLLRWASGSLLGVRGLTLLTLNNGQLAFTILNYHWSN